MSVQLAPIDPEAQLDANTQQRPELPPPAPPDIGIALPMLNALSAHAAILNATGTIVAVNPAWEQFARANGAPDPATSGVGVNYLAVCQAAIRAQSSGAIEVYTGIQAVLAGEQEQFRCQYPCHAPQEQRWFQLCVVPLDPDRHRILVLHENISADRQIQEARGRLAAIVESSDDAIAVKTIEGTIITWNAGAERMYGYRADEMIGQPMMRIVPTDRREEEAQMMARMACGERISHFESVRVHRDGRHIDVSMSIASVFDARGMLLGISSSARDITVRKRAEQALQRQTTFNRLLQDVAVAANKANSLDDALQSALDHICTSIGWPVGRAYLIDQGDLARLASSPIWHVDEPDRFERFCALTEALSAAPEFSLPAQAMAARKPCWVADVRTLPTAMARLIQDMGVRAGFALPVLLGEEIVAVLEFYSADPIAPDHALLEVLTNVGIQLGRVLDRARAEQSLRASAEHYQLLFDRNPLPLWVYDLETLAFLAVNDAMVQHYGYARAEFLTMSIIDLGLPEDTARVRDVIAAITANPAPLTGNWRHKKQDGSIIDVETASQALTFRGRSARLALVKDVTDRKQAEEALLLSATRLRLVWESANDAMALSDADGIVVDANPAYAQLYGYPLEQIIGQPYSLIFPEDQRAAALAAYRDYFYDAEPSRQVETLVHCADGAECWVDSSAVFIVQDGRRTGLLSVIRDITERKRLQDAVMEERALLVRRIEERTSDLSAANAQLARAARLKDEFLSNMSHELRTPLSAVLGLSESLQEDIYGILNDPQRNALHEIEESGRHLLELINDILDLAKIGADKLELIVEPVSIVDVCQASLRMVKQVAHTKQLTVEASFDRAPPRVHADARRLKQILVNLLSNAAKFTPEGGAIGLIVEGDAEAQRICFTVWDSGIGIAPEHFDRLFQPFVQLDGRLARQYEGTGLGLALVSRMVDMHGGSITVSSTVHAGSRFTVALPWQPAEAPDPLDEPVEGLDLVMSRPMRQVLLIEDSPTSTAEIARHLGDFGMVVDTLSTGGSAVARAATLQPDIILLDILLPDISGWEVLSQLKADPITQAIPVVVISALDQGNRGRELGAAAYIVKPCTRYALNQLLASFHDEATAKMQALAEPGLLAGPLVLLAEDNQASITTIADYLIALGYQVSIARNGVEAIARAHELHPALILMDIQMPTMDGLEATRRIRADASLRAIPIIAITALAMPGDYEMCLAAGANHYLSKPVSLKGLAATVATYLQADVSTDRAPQ